MKKRILTILLSFAMLMGISVALPEKSYAFEDTGNATFNAFINDARYTEGVAWSNCYTYVQAFTGYCFGNSNFKAGAAFSNVGEVRAGDVIWINRSHYFAVLKRNGNSLYVAEGNYNGRVKIRWGYTITGSSINNETWTGWHWGTPANPTPTPPPQGSEMSSGYARAIPDGDYLIAYAGTSDKTKFYYLDIEGTKVPADNGTNVSLCGALSGDPPSYEVWTLKYENGFYTIKQKGPIAGGTDVSLDVAGINRSSGANIMVHSYNGGSNQKWAISHNGNNGYRIQSKCSGFSVDVAGGGCTSGTNVQQHQNNNSDAQSWLFIPYRPAQTLENGRYILLSAMDNRVELDVAGNANPPENANVQIWDDTAISRYNSFDVKKLSNGYYKITHADSGKGLDVSNAVSTKGSNICIHTANDSVAQQWAITKDGYNGGYVLRAKCSGYALDAQGATTANGTNVMQHPINYGKNQTWVFVPAEYSIIYNANGGSNAPANQLKYYKEAINLRNGVPIRSGYTLNGWNTKSDGSGTSYAVGENYNTDRDLTLYAQWIKNASLKPTNPDKPSVTPNASSEKVDLPTVTISSAKSAKKAAVVRWKKVSKKNQKKIAKIQIQYSTDKTFKTDVKTATAKKSATSKKIKKLKSKKQYYFRVRSYKKVNGVVHVSKWSKVKRAKIK